MTITAERTAADVAVRRPDLDRGLGAAGRWGFVVATGAAIAYVAYSIYADASAAGVQPTTYLPFILLFVSLLIALGFEFVNGFHDTANAVATVIYTHSLPAHVAVVWSGVFNFLGVLVSSGAVAYSIISLLPVELILRVGSQAGFAMVFALLIAAIVWNLATWYFGLPSSSSHTLVGSIIGVGVANAVLSGHGGTAGVEWGEAAKVGYSLLLSPILGFALAAILFKVMRVLVRNEALYREPSANTPPPAWIRGLLIFTCTGVSFLHGSNDGQKGMGLIMLILIGTVPTAYALNRAVPESYMPEFHQRAEAVVSALAPRGPYRVDAAVTAEAALQRYISQKTLQPDTLPALASLATDIDNEVSRYGSLQAVPAAVTKNVRNAMYLASEAIKRLQADETVSLTPDETSALSAFKASLDAGTRFIPTWVKVAVAFALGLGTMVGWKRIVVTVGEKIGKQHLTYGQGASAELVAMATIGLADRFGLPVSTTHVLSSGVAGTMVANGTGLQMSTVRNLGAAWLLTLPISMLLSAGLYALFLQLA
ncbi:nuclease PIN [Aureimonas ureilytica]|uniref:Phosphate transporter n=2 Tax=Aureimonas ureilytica TaxID=401562 RepID=A0A175RHE7_9HYPH|nr:inorganic phosphate transporter [Aureimonas ureilytica]KTR03197.1 nuclease PIN [Aureimonas ureilytica]